MKTIEDLLAGDEVWIADVNSRGKPPRSDVIKSVGRKYLTVGNRKFCRETGRAADAYGHQWIIPDLDAFNERSKMTAVLLKIQRGRFNCASLTDAIEAARLLGVNLEAP